MRYVAAVGSRTLAPPRPAGRGVGAEGASPPPRPARRLRPAAADLPGRPAARRGGRLHRRGQVDARQLLVGSGSAPAGVLRPDDAVGGPRPPPGRRAMVRRPAHPARPGARPPDRTPTDGPGCGAPRPTRMSAGLALLDAPDIDSVVDRQPRACDPASRRPTSGCSSRPRPGTPTPCRGSSCARPDRGTAVAVVLDRVPGGPRRHPDAPRVDAHRPGARRRADLHGHRVGRPRRGCCREQTEPIRCGCTGPRLDAGRGRRRPADARRGPASLEGLRRWRPSAEPGRGGATAGEAAGRPTTTRSADVDHGMATARCCAVRCSPDGRSSSAPASSSGRSRRPSRGCATGSRRSSRESRPPTGPGRGPRVRRGRAIVAKGRERRDARRRARAGRRRPAPRAPTLTGPVIAEADGAIHVSCTTGRATSSRWSAARAGTAARPPEITAYGVNGLGRGPHARDVRLHRGITGAEVGIAGGPPSSARSCSRPIFGDQAVRDHGREGQGAPAGPRRGRCAPERDRFAGESDDRRAAPPGREPPPPRPCGRRGEPRPDGPGEGPRVLRGGPADPGRPRSARAGPGRPTQLDAATVASACRSVDKAGERTKAGRPHVVASPGQPAAGSHPCSTRLAGAELAEIGAAPAHHVQADACDLGRAPGRRVARLAAVVDARDGTSRGARRQRVGRPRRGAPERRVPRRAGPARPARLRLP